MALLGECCSGALQEAPSSHRAVYLQVPRNKIIDIEFSDVKFSVHQRRKGESRCLLARCQILLSIVFIVEGQPLLSLLRYRKIVCSNQPKLF